MSEHIVEMPWELLGHLQDKFQTRLNEELKNVGRIRSIAYLELTIYAQSTSDESPSAEYNLGGGKVGKRLPVDDDIQEDKDELSTEEQRAAIDGLLRQMLNQLNDETNEHRPRDQRLRVGVRALIYSSNPGYSCSGFRCEWRATHQKWWLRYYYERNGKCKKRWIEPC